MFSSYSCYCFLYGQKVHIYIEKNVIPVRVQLALGFLLANLLYKKNELNYGFCLANLMEIGFISFILDSNMLVQVCVGFSRLTNPKIHVIYLIK